MTVNEPRELLIERLGARGDGVARIDGGMTYIPFALPGERVSAGPSRDASRTLVEVLRPSPDRVAPVCRHFGVCGGCRLQHIETGAYLAWKREQVRIVFAARGLDVQVAPIMTFPGARRRRAALTARRDKRSVILGFHVMRSHEIIGIAECPVLAPEIERALPALARIGAEASGLNPWPGIVLDVLRADNGLDVLITGTGGVLSPLARERLAKEALAAKFLRLTEARDTIYETAAPFVRFGPACVTPPPGAFLQAMVEAEAAMAELVCAAAGKAKRVADLFCGLGAFTFPLARRAEVLAIDSNPAAVEALARAARGTSGVKRITAKARDLFRAPLSPTELKDFDAVVFNAPRAGAKTQAESIARSNVPAAVAVSCDMATLARDARILLDGGYRIETIMPIDQFQYSAHVEAVAVFRR